MNRLIYRHSVAVRITHWINFVVITIMLMSGLQIFNARPDLYWGSASDFDHPLVAFEAKMVDGKPIGITKIFGEEYETTGWLGLSWIDGRPVARAFPPWATIPGPQWLAMGRQWHFFFAWLLVLNGVAYILYSFASGHFRRDILPKWHDIKHLGADIWDHLRFRYPANEHGRYNVLQKLSYLFVAFGLGLLIVATGLSMSPMIDAAAPWLPALFGGRQSARTIHFCAAFTFAAFFVVHIVMVLASGAFNNVRSMITGRFAVKATEQRDER